MRVLIVEDDVKMASLLVTGLREEGFDPDVAHAGERGMSMATEQPYDAVVLDRMLPGIDGLTLCRRLRQQGNPVPVLMLTALGETADLVTGLEAGADDYLPKPFAFEELFARLRALARRPPLTAVSTVEVGDLRLDRSTHRVWRGSVEISLSAREFDLLDALMRRPDDVLTRDQLLMYCWKGTQARSNVVDAYIRYLRQKIDRPFDTTSIETVRGAGYRFRADGGSATD